MQRKLNSEIPEKLSPDSNHRYMCPRCWVHTPQRTCPKCGEPTRLKLKYQKGISNVKQEYQRAYRKRVRERTIQTPNRSTKVEHFKRSKELRYFCHKCCSHCKSQHCLCCGAGEKWVRIKKRYQEQVKDDKFELKLKIRN